MRSRQDVTAFIYDKRGHILAVGKNSQTVIATTYDKRGKIIAKTVNSYSQTHPLQKRLAQRAGLPEKIYLHAEIRCIIKSKNKNIHKIVIERYNHQGLPLNAKPCPICELAIKEANIRFVEYTVG